MQKKMATKSCESCVDFIFRNFLNNLLGKYENIDTSVCVDYFLTLLEEGCDAAALEEWIRGICPDLPENEFEVLSRNIYSAYSGRQQLFGTAMNESVNKTSSSSSSTNCDTAEEREPVEDPDVFVGNEAMSCKSQPTNVGDDGANAIAESLSIGVASAVFDCDTANCDVDAFDDIIDTPALFLADLAFVVEEHLERRYPSIIFSNELIVNLLAVLEYSPVSVANIISRAYDTASNCRPCRHLMNSSCKLVNCPFEHNLQYIPCKYWLLLAGCRAFNEQSLAHPCLFLHDIPAAWLEEESRRNQHGQNFAADIDDDAEPNFPILSTGSVSQQVTRKEKPCDPLDSLLKTSKSKKTKKVILLGAASYQPKHERIVDQRSLPAPSKQGTTCSVDVAAAARWFHSSSDTRHGGIMASDGISWVETGVSVGTEYALARQKAREAALARNKLLDNATKAYIAGSMGLARELSSQGQALNQEMKAFHSEAAHSIFGMRNSKETLANGQLDLHGLHLAEAEACLFETVPTIQYIVNLIRNKKTDQFRQLCLSAGPAGSVFSHLCSSSPIVRSGKVTIVSGSGHHSVGIANAGKVSRLLDRVKQLLTKMSMSFTEYKDKNGYVGGVSVAL